MMKYEFLEHVNSIREERGYNLLSDIPEEDYAVVEKVYTFHPMFDVRPGGENPKRLIASIYTLYRATCNGMALIRALLP